MRHDNAADHARGNAPARGVAIGELAVLVLETDVLRLGEVRTEEMRGSGLQRLSVLHHRFDGIGVHRARETLILGLLARDHRHRQRLLRERAIDFQHLHGFFDRLFFGGVSGVAFLPEKFGRAQKQARANFPANHICPLVEQHRQVAIALDPAREGIADDRFRGRAHDERLFELGVGIGLKLAVDVLQTVMGDHRHLLGEAFDMFGLLGDEGEGDEEREIGVLVPGLLDAAVELVLDLAPTRRNPRA